MPDRRSFLTSIAAAAVPALSHSIHACAGVGNDSVRSNRQRRAQKLRIKGAIRRDETILRLGGDGDNFHMSWAADDRQLVSVCDGAGWDQPARGRYNGRLWAIEKGPKDAKFHRIPSWPRDVARVGDPQYYPFGTLALNGEIYVFLSTARGHFNGAKLIYSPDNGLTWRNQDGSTPVIWEPHELQSRQNMVFFEEPQNTFSLLSVLQMGRGYEENRDGYVYIYSPNGSTEGTMNELVMLRVPKDQLRNRSAYEFFSGLRSNGAAVWAKDIRSRAVVHQFPPGWLGEGGNYAWMPSITYNAPLDVYMMASWGWDFGGKNALEKPSYLGFWLSEHPWGPWIQFHEEKAWMPGGDPKALAYQPQIAPKWIAPDGKSFWLVWTDFQITDAEKSRKINEEIARVPAWWTPDHLRLFEEFRKLQPFYSFNLQRVDLVIG